MSGFTAAVLTAFAVYALAWYGGAVQGNFALLLMLATGVTGLYWLAEKFWFWPQRKRAAQRLLDEHKARLAALEKQGFGQSLDDVEPARQQLLRQPWWLDWTAGLFPVILAVFVLRSFLFEPFKIPSGSMIPTLHVGDLILVNKFHYGVRLPVFHHKLLANQQPQRGDVMVFRFPPQPSLDYIKRVVAVPGDQVSYLNKRLSINGELVPRSAEPDFFDPDTLRHSRQYTETLQGRHFGILNDDDRPAFIAGATDFAYRDLCSYTIEGVSCTVPSGHFFVLGDNRDNSLDSRFWGFVPEANIVGKAFFVWMNFGDLSRIGRFE
ncbi:signal peptidase I [Hydrogenophaga sp.]|uniref:signal peptidase I n=1 Tax=Hydrogenophaga sp. TaxID=1904254 RepID=UPI0019C3781A|nr:signal peptidase I [Hydrogenophaga sp.]MBD3893258.1 signal peptidase I [Hydrogenophaga sp.]